MESLLESLYWESLYWRVSIRVAIGEALLHLRCGHARRTRSESFGMDADPNGSLIDLNTDFTGIFLTCTAIIRLDDSSDEPVLSEDSLIGTITINTHTIRNSNLEWCCRVN